MKNFKFILFFTITLLFLTTFTNAQSKPSKYIGSPENDADFISFVQNNLGKIVILNLTLSDDDSMISQGYKGVQPMFDGAKVKEISYSFFLECDGEAYNNETGVYQCKNTKWNESNGKLSGKFKISRIIKTKMRNYRAVFLVPIK